MTSLLRSLSAAGRRYDRASLAAAWWAASQLRPLRRAVRTRGLEAFVPPPPELPSRAVRGVTAFAEIARMTCLERSLVLQRWLVEHGREHDILVGVANSSTSGFRAHAWVEGFDPEPLSYEVLTTVPAPPAVGSAWPSFANTGDHGYDWPASAAKSTFPGRQ